jgi:hypothetical protein
VEFRTGFNPSAAQQPNPSSTAPRVDLSFVPIAGAAEMITIGIRADKRTYSAIDAPDSSFKNRAAFMMPSPVLFYLAKYRPVFQRLKEWFAFL